MSVHAFESTVGCTYGDIAIDKNGYFRRYWRFSKHTKTAVRLRGLIVSAAMAIELFKFHLTPSPCGAL